MLEADAGYLSRLARKARQDEAAGQEEALAATRKAMLAALEAGARGEIPEHGPRGGALWTRATLSAGSPGTRSTTPGRLKTGFGS